MRRHLTPELVLLALAAFLGTVIGGQVSIDPMALPAGGIVAGIMGGGELPLLARALVGGLIAAGLVTVCLRRRVLQVPAMSVALGVVALALLLGASIGFSAFRQASTSAWLTWAVYAMAFFLTVTAVGRQSGPRVVLGALVAGGAIVSLKGIVEYLSRMAVEPSYRIFADYNNPNALAGLLVVVLPVALGLAMAEEGKARYAAAAGGALISVALVLTQSRGGYLAAAVGLVALVAVALAWKARGRVVWALAPLVVAALLTFGIRAATPGDGGNAFARVTGQVATGEQSGGYRVNLWRGTVELAKMRPQGWGIGTYRYESARPGITPQTYMSHQTYLQTAAEGGWLALAALLWIAVAWLARLFRDPRALPLPTNLLRAGVVGGIVAAGAHGIVESNLFYFGIGLTVFVLLGVGLQLSPDASSPELFPPSMRRAMALTAGVIGLGLLFFGTTELRKCLVVTALTQGPPEALQPAIDGMLAAAAGDGEAWALAAYSPVGRPARDKALQRAAEFAPTTRNLRALARVELAKGNASAASIHLGAALARDPNNLATLWQLVEMYREAQSMDLAERFARRLVAVEQTPYFQIRAIPEIVPTETYRAREFLAGLTDDPAARLELLRPAFEGYVRFARSTVPLVVQASRDPALRTQGFLGISLEDVARELDSGVRVGREVESLLRARGDGASADEVAAGLSVLAEARASASTVTDSPSP